MQKQAIKIKGTKNGLVIFLDSNQKFEDIKYSLVKKMKSSRGFFHGAKYSFYPSVKKLVPQQEKELELICQQYGLVPNIDMTTPDIEAIFLSPPQINKEDNLPGQRTLLLKKALRSGQYISHPAHIVILGNVHPGARVEAGGNILVMGQCSGTLHAGVTGDQSAIVTAFELKTQLIRIANIAYTAPDSGENIQTPHKALIKNNKITIVTI